MVNRGENTIPPNKHLDPSQELKRLKNLIGNFPETREDEVLELKSRFLRTPYKVRPDLVAEKIILHGTQMLAIAEDKDDDHLFAM